MSRSRHAWMAPAVALGLFAAVPYSVAAVRSSPGVPALVIDGGTSMTLSGATRLTLDCDLRNYGAFSPAGGSELTVNGYGSPLLLGVSGFADLALELSGTAALANAATVAGTLTLGSGRLSLAGHDLAANAVAGGSAASYVVTPDTLGRLVRGASSGAPTNFPVGDAGFDPVTVRTGVGADVFRVAVMDAPPAGNLTPAAALTRGWAIAQANAPGADGALTCSLQWSAGETGASFDRSLGSATSALAWRYLAGAWVPEPGARVSDNASYPAVDGLVSANTGLWTLASPGALLAVDPPGTTGAPRVLELAQNSPNPVARTCSLRYGLPRRGEVSLALFSLLGERVATLVQGVQEPGYHVANLDATRLAGGLYFCRLQAGGASQSRKIVVTK